MEKLYEVILDFGEIHASNAEAAREQALDEMLEQPYDLASLIQVREIEREQT